MQRLARNNNGWLTRKITANRNITDVIEFARPMGAAQKSAFRSIF